MDTVQLFPAMGAPTGADVSDDGGEARWPREVELILSAMDVDPSGSAASARDRGAAPAEDDPALRL